MNDYFRPLITSVMDILEGANLHDAGKQAVTPHLCNEAYQVPFQIDTPHFFRTFTGVEMEKGYNMTDDRPVAISFPIILTKTRKNAVHGEEFFFAVDDNSFGLEGINVFPKAKGGGRLILTIKKDGASVKEILESIGKGGENPELSYALTKSD
jgi:hypothetical protein